MITITTRPRTTDLTTLARVKSRLGIPSTSTALDASLADDITFATSLLEQEISRSFAMAILEEPVAGDDTTVVMLTRRPVVEIYTVDEDDHAIDASEYQLDDPNAGTVIREAGWWRSAPQRDVVTRDPGPMRGFPRYRFAYRGGYRLPGDNVSASGLAVSAAARTIALLAGDDRAPWPLLASGESVRLTGFTNGTNKGYKTIADRSDLVLTFADDLATETAPAGAVVETQTAPPALERLCLDTVRTWYLDRTRSLNVTSERIGDWAAQYADVEYARILPASVASDVCRLFGLYTP